jgi:hypothetical protein
MEIHHRRRSRLSPAATNQVVVFGSYDGKLYVLDALSGTLRWSYQTEDKIVSSPAIAYGNIYVGSYDHMVYAFGSNSAVPPDVWPLWIWTVIIIIVILVMLAAVLLLKVFMKP